MWSENGEGRWTRIFDAGVKVMGVIDRGDYGGYYCGLLEIGDESDEAYHVAGYAQLRDEADDVVHSALFDRATGQICAAEDCGARLTKFESRREARVCRQHMAAVDPAPA